MDKYCVSEQRSQSNFVCESNSRRKRKKTIASSSSSSSMFVVTARPRAVYRSMKMERCNHKTWKYIRNDFSRPLFLVFVRFSRFQYNRPWPNIALLISGPFCCKDLKICCVLYKKQTRFDVNSNWFGRCVERCRSI